MKLLFISNINKLTEIIQSGVCQRCMSDKTPYVLGTSGALVAHWCVCLYMSVGSKIQKKVS